MNAAPTIRVHNAQRKVAVSVEELQAFAEAAVSVARRIKLRRGASFATLNQIDVLLVSDARIAALHKRFMSIAGPTDVITFQHGDIVVSAETAKANARRFRTTTDAEIRLYIAHGILHLIGFDDTTAAAAREMAKRQERLVAAATAEIERRAAASGRLK